MQTEAIVSRLLRCCEPLMHAARWQALRDVALSCGRRQGGEPDRAGPGNVTRDKRPTPREMR